MENYKTEKKKINGVFLLMCAVKFLIIALGYVVSHVIVNIAPSRNFYRELVGELYSYNSLSGILLEMAFSLLATAVPLIIYFALKGKGTVRETMLLSKPTFFQTGYAVGATVLISNFVSNIGVTYIYGFYDLFGFDPNTYYITPEYPTNIWFMPLFFMLLAFFPALLEELLFRGAMMGSMRKFGRGFVIVMSGVTFMMMHNTLEQLPLALSAGMCLAYFTFKFRSVWVAVIAHFVINLNSAIVGIIFEVFEGSSLVMILLIYSLFYSSLMLGLVVAGTILYGFKLPVIDKPTAEEKKGRARLIFTSPFFYIFVALFIYSTGSVIWDVISFGLNR